MQELYLSATTDWCRAFKDLSHISFYIWFRYIYFLCIIFIYLRHWVNPLRCRININADVEIDIHWAIRSIFILYLWVILIELWLFVSNQSFNIKTHILWLYLIKCDSCSCYVLNWRKWKMKYFQKKKLTVLKMLSQEILCRRLTWWSLIVWRGWKKPFMSRISKRHCVTNFVSLF